MKPETGVYFVNQDYAGLWRRLLIDTVDAATVLTACAAVTIPLWSWASKDLMIGVWAAVFFCYFVLLKRSRFRTLGYRLGRVRIVGIDGATPGLWPLTLRLTFMVLGPVNYLVDVLWVSTDVHRQALRDKFAQTYIVRKDACPAGKATVIFRYYDIFGYNCLFRELQPSAEGERE